MSHIRKRQFQPSANQPSITSFFTRIDPANPTADFNPYDRKHVPSFSQPLPDPVQSQLMNMGMRIRKSVPEGYKTHKTLGPASSAPAYNSLFAQSNMAPASSAPSVYTKPNELMPMCGLHKIGGHSSQPSVGTTTSSVPELSYSQSTISSSTSSRLPIRSVAAPPQTPPNIRKRSYNDEIEDELDAFFSDEVEKEIMVDEPTSQTHKYPFSHSSMPGLDRKTGLVNPGSRPKARMRTRGDAQSKMVAFGGYGADKDFEDEDVKFLAPMDCD